MSALGGLCPTTKAEHHTLSAVDYVSMDPPLMSFRRTIIHEELTPAASGCLSYDQLALVATFFCDTIKGMDDPPGNPELDEMEQRMGDLWSMTVKESESCGKIVLAVAALIGALAVLMYSVTF